MLRRTPRVVAVMADLEEAAGAGLDDGCLATAVPADATRFGVHDGALAARLRSAGAILVTEEADVEIGPPRLLRAEAPCVVIPLGPGRHREGGRPVLKATRRVLQSLLVRARAAASSASLARRGYPRRRVIRWDIGQTVRLAGAGEPRLTRRVSHRFPRRALVVGTRRDLGDTMFEAAVAAASRTNADPVEGTRPLGRPGLLVSVGPSVVLRVAIGPAVERVDGERAAVESVRRATGGGPIADLLPTSLGHGTAGLAHWSLETRLPGAPARPPLARPLLDGCLDFLTGLHALRADGGSSSPTADAERLARRCPPGLGARLTELALEVEQALDDVPRGYGHGDFWHANLLVEGGRLVGVVDWDASGPGRLPLLDLMHLHVNARRRRGFENWGPAVVEHLLPWSSSGGDELARRYLRRLGLEPSGPDLRALVIAYWLNRLAYQVARYSDLLRRPVWVRSSITVVLEALG